MIHDLIELDRPLISVDLETTGLYPHVDRIVQIGVIKLYPDGKLTEWESLIDPGVPIPSEAAAVHHITNETVKDSPLFETIALKLLAGFHGCDFTGYNLKPFDIPFLKYEFQRCGMVFKPGRIVDCFSIFKQYNPRNLSAAVRHYLGEELVDAHSAMADARASFRILRAQLIAHKELPRTIEGLDQLVKPNPDHIDPDGKLKWNRAGEAIFTFGKYSGRTLKDTMRMDQGYCQFILNANFTPELKAIIRNALSGQFPTRGK